MRRSKVSKVSPVEIGNVGLKRSELAEDMREMKFSIKLSSLFS